MMTPEIRQDAIAGTDLKAIEFISDYELKRHVQRQRDAVINIKKEHLS